MRTITNVRPAWMCLLLAAAIASPGRPDEHAKPIAITVCYDNYVLAEGVTADWGFSCLIQGLEKAILFDTGTQGDLLLDNMRTLGVSPQDADVVVISHNHQDHWGGLPAVLQSNSDVHVYLPTSFSQEQIDEIEATGADVTTVAGPTPICPRATLTGTINRVVPEQTLILRTPKGLIVVVGCSHPGIVHILEQAKAIGQDEIYFVFGGFHLGGYADSEIEAIIEQFRALGVRKVGPTHCTGDRAIQMFREAYGKDFVPMGVGPVQVPPESDIDGDGETQLGDFAHLASRWLTGTDHPAWTHRADLGPGLGGDGIVDIHDMRLLAQNWLTLPGIVAHWTLDEDSGDVAHDQASGHNSQLHGRPIWQPGMGRLGGALQLDGVDDYIETPAALNPSSGPFSIFVWVKGGLPGQVVLSQRDTADWLLADPGDGCVSTQLKGTGRYAAGLCADAMITDGAWHRLGLVWDGTQRILYAEDDEVARDTQTGLNGADAALYIGAGRKLDSGTFWSGLIDDVRVYNRVIVP